MMLQWLVFGIVVAQTTLGASSTSTAPTYSMLDEFSNPTTLPVKRGKIVIFNCENRVYKDSNLITYTPAEVGEKAEGSGVVSIDVGKNVEQVTCTPSGGLTKTIKLPKGSIDRFLVETNTCTDQSATIKCGDPPVVHTGFLYCNNEATLATECELYKRQNPNTEANNLALLSSDCLGNMFTYKFSDGITNINLPVHTLIEWDKADVLTIDTEPTGTYKLKCNGADIKPKSQLEADKFDIDRTILDIGGIVDCKLAKYDTVSPYGMISFIPFYLVSKSPGPIDCADLTGSCNYPKWVTGTTPQPSHMLSPTKTAGGKRYTCKVEVKQCYPKIRNYMLTEEQICADPTSTSPSPSTPATSSTSASTPTTTQYPPTSSTERPKENATSKKLAGGAIAGIVIGVLAGVALIGGGIYYFVVVKPKG